MKILVVKKRNKRTGLGESDAQNGDRGKEGSNWKRGSLKKGW